LKSLILLEALRYTGMAVNTSVADWYAKTGVTGRRWHVTKIFFMLLFLLYGGFVGGMYVLGLVLHLIM
jgi:hypothetical protein